MVGEPDYQMLTKQYLTTPMFIIPYPTNIVRTLPPASSINDQSWRGALKFPNMALQLSVLIGFWSENKFSWKSRNSDDCLVLGLCWFLYFFRCDIASPSTYPCQSVSRSVSGIYRACCITVLLTHLKESTHRCGGRWPDSGVTPVATYSVTLVHLWSHTKR